MKSMRIAIVAFVGIVIALWWAVMPPRFAPQEGGRLADQKRMQCPANSHLDGKLCVCAAGSSWTGAACEQQAALP
ncbi:MAG: hypothetical protein V4631_10055 [Pseudomonadota bacterium]